MGISENNNFTLEIVAVLCQSLLPNGYQISLRTEYLGDNVLLTEKRKIALLGGV